MCLREQTGCFRYARLFLAEFSLCVPFGCTEFASFADTHEPVHPQFPYTRKERLLP